MLLKIKKLYSDAHIPTRIHDGDAGYDLYSRENHAVQPGETHHFKLGFATEIDPRYVALVWARSSMGAKSIAVFGGVIDAGYRGEWGIMLHNSSQQPLEIKKDDRIAQVIFQEKLAPEIQEVEELEETTRGAGAFGSTNKSSANATKITANI